MIESSGREELQEFTPARYPTRLRRMAGAHRSLPVAGWTRLLGALLAAYGLYVVCRVAAGIGG
ncbi:hypothetical protein [Streptomyces sp. XY006]|uniref:hypothetical protein n=1 Tax=Streptomyces sp. XY006 TaxID=2021410 RepID=UPI000B8C6DE8|nr:hypothetical protein [Streptomyces sp. XY006]OXS31859.1 hypothetical protein CHR28_29090 [Streptomyces sp. XY006]